MICSSVVTCLSNGFPENNKIMSVFVLFSQLFGHFVSMAFYLKMGDKPYTKLVKRHVGQFPKHVQK